MIDFGRDQAHAGQFGVGLVVARQERQLHAAGAARGHRPLDPIGPIARPAQQPQHHQLGVGDHRFDIPVDRKIVRQIHQIGEPDGGKTGLDPGGRQARARAGEAREFGIGGGQHDDVARALAQIHGLRPVGDASRLCCQEMHQSAPIAVAMATRSRPDWPITTSRPSRASPSRQSRSK